MRHRPKITDLSLTASICPVLGSWVLVVFLRAAPIPTVCVLLVLVAVVTALVTMRQSRPTRPQPQAAPKRTAPPKPTNATATS
jgi:hypothetical protein